MSGAELMRVFEDRIYVYPTPNGAYAVTIWGLQELTARIPAHSESVSSESGTA